MGRGRLQPGASGQGLRARFLAFRCPLAELHRRHVDMVAACDKLLDVAEPEFVVIVREFRQLHVRQADLVAAMLTEDGHAYSPNASIFGRVNRAVTVVRAWFDDISTNMIDALVAGEKHLIEALDAAISNMADGGRRRTLAQSRAELVALIERHAGRG